MLLKLSCFLVLCQAGISQYTHQCSNQYRTLNGSCSNMYNPTWGSSSQVLSSTLLPSRRASPLSSKILAEEPDREEPVTEWLGAWTSFIKSDLIELKESGRGILNAGTPVLDLSNLYGVQGDHIYIDSGKIDYSWEIGEKVLWRLFESEHNRLVDDLTHRNIGWGTSKARQEARKILIGEYESILINEVMPLLLGDGARKLQQEILSESVENVTGEDLLVGLHAYLAMGSSELEHVDSTYINSKDGWMDFAHRMLNLKLVIPGGGITMDRLEDVSDALDTLGHVEHRPWLQARMECGLYDDDKFVEAVMRTGKEISSIDSLLGGLAEEPELGAVLSPTLSCLLRKVLAKTIKGDNFWYSKGGPNGFTKDQIEALNHVTLASLLCENIGNLGHIQPSAFLLPDYRLNNEIMCDHITKLDLRPWDNSEQSFDSNEAEEVEIAIATAAENLMEFRKYEYTLYQNNYVAPFHSGLRALGSVVKPSIKVQNARNNSALFEFVTYEFMRRPNLRRMMNAKINPSRKKRQTRTFDIIVRDPLETTNNAIFEDKIITKLQGMPHQEKYYKTISIKRTIISSPSQNSVDSSIVTEGKCLPAEDKQSCTEFLNYRSYSGWCNNLRYPKRGESNTVHRRFIPSEYDDGISKPRTKSKRGSKLPNARKVSTEIHTHEQIPDPKYTLMVMQWGQFIDHDLTHTPMSRGFHETVLRCSRCDSSEVHPACFPIPVSEDDSFYAFNPVDPKCIPFARSVAGQQHLGPREQVNQLTSYLDGSMVYGSDECQMSLLREPNSYLMKTFKHPLNSQGGNYKDLPPRTREHPECFSPSGECFLGGDSRINEHPGLTVMHTILLREHNAVATELARINPHWDTNKVFEEARRIVIAEIQHITYNEFLPRVLGRNNLKAFDLDLLTSSYYFDYDEECSATTFNEFATAAFRFGHSTIRQNLTLMSEEAALGRSAARDIFLRDHFNNPDIVMEIDLVDNMMRGFMMMPMEAMDNRVTVEIANHLFEQRNIPKSGMDLIALNIQRARDHGIPGYNNYREMCKLSRAKTFVDFKEEIPLDIIYRMQKIYKHPDDVDLFTGLLSETKLNGALTGPTLACLLGLQFSHLRKCDRFWYETGDPRLRFTTAQLKEIRATSIAGLLCKNMDQDTMMPRSCFDQMDRLTNPMVRCSSTIKHLDLSQWKDADYRVSTCQVGDRTILQGERYRVSPCTSCLCTRQGAKCETVNLHRSGSSCLEIVRDWGIKKVEEDLSCRPQCRIV